MIDNRLPTPRSEVPTPRPSIIDMDGSVASIGFYDMHDAGSDDDDWCVCRPPCCLPERPRVSVASSSGPVEGSRASPTHRPREDGLTHPADTSRSNLADALGLLSSWRLSKPSVNFDASTHVAARASRVPVECARMGTRWERGGGEEHSGGHSGRDGEREHARGRAAQLGLYAPRSHGPCAEQPRGGGGRRLMGSSSGLTPPRKSSTLDRPRAVSPPGSSVADMEAILSVSPSNSHSRIVRAVAPTTKLPRRAPLTPPFAQPPLVQDVAWCAEGVAG
jgi:hypothetical protein